MLSEKARANRKAYQKRWHQENKERLNAEARVRYFANREERLAKQLAYHRSKKFDEEYLSKRRARQSERRRRQIEWWKQYKSKLSCSVCGENRVPCLDFHHVNRDEKEFSISMMLKLLKNKEAIMLEISKCIVLCANCHRVTHSDECN